MSFSTAYATKKRGKKMAKGGDVKGVHKGINDPGDRAQAGTSKAGFMTAMAKGSSQHAEYKAGAKKEHEHVLEEMRSMPKPKLPMAEGGEIEEMGEYDPMEHPMPVDNEAANMEDADMIARIMHSRKKYSEGGQVANDVGVAEADEKPAEYDDLVLRDDDMEEADYTAKNSGDLVGRILAKRKK